MSKKSRTKRDSDLSLLDIIETEKTKEDRLGEKLDSCPDDIRYIATENALTVLKRRYLKRDEEGNVLEEPKDMFWRVATTIAKNERFYNKELTEEDIYKIASEYFNIMVKRDFMPNSPTLMNAGRELGQLSACFVLPIEDSMSSIFQTVKDAALIHKSGGGTGFSFSRLRPKNDVVKSTKGVSSGPISFMTVFNQATETIKQGGTRRGANMAILRVDHPDILEFITCKDEEFNLNNFNISVALTDEFMKAVEEDTEYPLINPRTDEIVQWLSANDVFNLMVKQAHKNGEPGIIFLDRINEDNPTPTLGDIESTNPCGEQPLLPYESCNLGSINLANMVTDNGKEPTIDWDRLEKTVILAVRFLDGVIDTNNYPLKKIEEMTKGNRKIGLGVMGFADMLYLLGIRYGNERSYEIAEEVMSFIEKVSHNTSRELAVQRGPFPNFKGSKFDNEDCPQIRNATLTTIAPTGTISIIANCSSGIEPLFSLVFYRKVLDGDKLVEVHPLFLEIAHRDRFYSEELMDKIVRKGSIKDIEEIPEEVREIFVTSHDITPEMHIKMQSIFQKYTDNAVSKTINFPNSATIEDVKDAYLLAYKERVKGLTVYRDGSREEQVLNIGKKESVKEKSPEDTDFGRLIPRERPMVTSGETRKYKTGCGSIYVTINWDEHGLCELFANMGKAGGCAASQTEAISRLISLDLRAGIDPSVIVKHLKNIRCHKPKGLGENKILSCPDAISRALEEKIKEFEDKDKKGIEEIKEEAEKKLDYDNLVAGSGACPECGGVLYMESGCEVCKSCGYSGCS